ncbi:MAG: hypothetical protein CM15mP88_2650 [Pseudomonadota bacterium]|nr:MAG: hypothetical protein CM15mP88_2650 [Pseudomonadota bacterium]
MNDEEICTAVIPMLERVGIKVTELSDEIKHFNKIGKAQSNNTSFFMLGWTPGSYDALNPLMQLMTTGKPDMVIGIRTIQPPTGCRTHRNDQNRDG